MAKPTPSKPATSTSSKKKTTEQETFEKELQALAAKAKEETYGKWALEQSRIFLISATLLALAATYSSVSQLTLSPAYGSIPASIYHDKTVVTALFLGWSLNLYLRRILPVKPIYLLPIIATYIPTIQFFLFQCCDFFGGTWGPVVTEVLTVFPLILVSSSCVATALDDLDLTHGRRFTWLSNAMPGISSFMFFKGAEFYSSNLISQTIGKTILHTRLGLQASLALSYSLFQPSKLLLLTLPAILHTALFNTHVPLPYNTNYLNSTMIKKDWSLLERKESLTGYLSIVESAEKGFRVMRCDHSLLGGEWLTATTKSNRTEPIYGIFVMLEAIRLIEVPNPVPDNEAKALVVGLGIGTTPLALHTHGINTTIVEIDPVVHEFAVKYFSFPSEINAKLVDAIAYTADLVEEGVEKFDYIVHDVFTGGAEPVELFTVEFISTLKALLKPDGVVAINYAGDLLLPSARIVIHTILSVFPTCRIYRESEDDTTDSSTLDFTNMVIFCINSSTPPAPSSKSDTSSSDEDLTDAFHSQDSTTAPKITFRRPVTADLLGSGARQMFILPRHEIMISEFGTRDELVEHGGLLYKEGARERFKGWHASSAVGHWGVMRGVLPPWVWTAW